MRPRWPLLCGRGRTRAPGGSRDHRRQQGRGFPRSRHVRRARPPRPPRPALGNPRGSPGRVRWPQARSSGDWDHRRQNDRAGAGQGGEILADRLADFIWGEAITIGRVHAPAPAGHLAPQPPTRHHLQPPRRRLGIRGRPRGVPGLWRAAAVDVAAQSLERRHSGESFMPGSRGPIRKPGGVAEHETARSYRPARRGGRRRGTVASSAAFSRANRRAGGRARAPCSGVGHRAARRSGGPPPPRRRRSVSEWV